MKKNWLFAAAGFRRHPFWKGPRMYHAYFQRFVKHLVPRRVSYLAEISGILRSNSAKCRSLLAGSTPRLLCMLCFLLLQPSGRSQGQPDMLALQATLGKWVEAKNLISKEKQDARQQEQMLKARIDLLDLRLKDITERSDETKQSTAEADEKKNELDAENVTFEETASLLKSHILGMETRTLALLKAAPLPIQTKLEALSNQIPKDSENTEMSLSLRYQNVIGILNALNNFNNEVTISTEVRQLSGGESLEVRVLYFGLSQAYYCNKDASIGGRGIPGTEAWEWERQDEIAPTVAAMIAQHLNEKSADYEPVPVTILTSGGQLE